MQKQGSTRLRRAGAGVEWEEFDQLATLFEQVAATSPSTQHPFRVGYAVRGALVGVGDMGTTAGLLALLRVMEQLPQWEALVHGDPEDLLGCDVLFTRV